MRSTILALLAVSAGAQNPVGGLNGIVSDALTHQPVKKAMITFFPVQPPAGQPQNSGPSSAASDVTGAFNIDNLPPGDYQLAVQHQDYEPGRQKVTVNAGEKTGPVKVEVIPLAVVSGRILDEDGDPLNGCFAQAHPVKQPEQGRAMGSSGEDGEYRLSRIPPGKYIVTARCTAPVFQPRPFSAGPDPHPSLAYPMQYYPLATDIKSAQVIEVTAGSDKSGVDFQMRPAPATVVRVTLSPSGAGGPQGRNGLNVQLMPAAAPGSGFWPRQQRGPAEDTIMFQQVFPGSYVVLAFSNGDNSVGAVQRIEVKDRPLETVIELKRSFEVSGTVEIEGNSSGKVPLNQINLFMRPEYPIGMQPPQTQVKEDGTFVLKPVLPAPWRLQVNGPGVFLKSAWLGSTDVTDQPLDFSSGTAEPLRLMLSTNTATIRGTALAGLLVGVFRDGESQFGAISFTGVDSSGQFTMGSLAPGKYRVAVAEAPDQMAEGGGQEVTVHEGETVTIDLKPQSQ